MEKFSRDQKQECQARDNLCNAFNNRSAVFGRELEQLRSTGYKQVGDYMIPEGKLK